MTHTLEDPDETRESHAIWTQPTMMPLVATSTDALRVAPRPGRMDLVSSDLDEVSERGDRCLLGHR